MKQLLPESNSATPVLRADYTMMEPAGNEPPPPSAFKLQKFFVFLLKHWPIPLLTLLLGSATGIGYVMTMPPTFVSRARLWETVRVRLPEGPLFSDEQNFLGTQTELLQSGKLGEMARVRLKSLSTNNAVPLEKDGSPLGVSISVYASARSSVFTVTAASSNPAFVQAYLDSLVNEYLQYKKDVRSSVSSGTIASINEEVLRRESELKTEQEALAVYERTNNLDNLKKQGEIEGNYLATLGTKLSEDRLALRLLDAAARDPQIKAGDALDGMTNAAGVTNALAAAQTGETNTTANAGGTNSLTAQSPVSEHTASDKELEMLQYERAKLSVYLRPNHPKIVKLDADIARSQKLVEIYRKQSQEQQVSARKKLLVDMGGIESLMKEYEAKVAQKDALMAEAGRLQRNVDRIQVVYNRLSDLMQNMGISKNIEQDNLAILETASPASRSYSEEMGVITKSIFGGLFAGVAIVFLIALRDDRFASCNEVSEKFGEIIVGQVPDIRGGSKTKKMPLTLVQDNDERHMYAESYRNLRSALLFLATEGERPKLLLITSAVPNEGKSTIAANLARMMAIGGARVLLVDGDMRRGALHDLLGVRQEPGLTELLRQPGELDAVIQTNVIPNLSFIGRGGSVHNPGDLLLGPELDTVLVELRKRFDYVVIDSCPIFASDDATTLAPKLDGTLFVVRSQYSRAKAVQEALELLYQRQARVLGLVFNRANSSSRTNYYYKYTEYYHRPSKTA